MKMIDIAFLLQANNKRDAIVKCDGKSINFIKSSDEYIDMVTFKRNDSQSFKELISSKEKEVKDLLDMKRCFEIALKTHWLYLVKQIPRRQDQTGLSRKYLLCRAAFTSNEEESFLNRITEMVNMDASESENFIENIIEEFLSSISVERFEYFYTYFNEAKGDIL